MRTIARPFAVLIALGWIAFWAGVIWLMWRPGYQASLDLTNLAAVGDIDASGVTRLLATIISALAIALALPVLLAAFMPQRTRVVEHTTTPVRESEPEPVRGYMDTTPTEPRIRAEVPTERAHPPASNPETTPTPVVERREVEQVPATADTHPAPVRAETSVTPSATARDDEMSSLLDLVHRHEQEIQRLREQMDEGRAHPAERDARERVPNGRT
jgi:hypothetical protein